MKVRVTEKQIRQSFDNKIIVGYCDLAHLLQCIKPAYYTCGIYGWNSDVYIIDNNTCIVTGYRPFGNIRTNNRNIIKKYEDKARKIYSFDNKDSYETKNKKCKKLLDKFVMEVLKK